MDVVYDFRSVTPDGDGFEFAVVRGSESAMPADARYTADLDIEIEVPEQETEAMEVGENDEPLYDLQWDKQEQSITAVHDAGFTGDGARIGVVDDGVLGAGDREIVAGLDGHPDLPNVRGDLSINFTGDGAGPGPLNDDHGTHCAGTAAAADNGSGVVGIAPDAEIVDLRVFSGQGASFASVAAATIAGAAPEGVPVDVGTPAANGERVFTGAGCDVLNLSLGSGPIPDDTAGLDVLVDFLSAAGEFAVAFGTLPIASAGNAGVDLDEGVTVLPAEADGYVSVGATGPIGFGWPVENDGQAVGPFTVENPIDVELPTEEPASCTNYGVDGVDVTAGGGNFDADAITGGVPIQRVLFDLVLATGISNLDGTQPEDVELDEYVPGFVFKAGTSFAAPNVAGFAALLFAADEAAGPEEVRAQIEETAVQKPVGRAAETTAPGADVNVNGDGKFDGDQPSNPGSVPGGRVKARDYRGEGHIDIPGALGVEVEEDDDEEEGEGRRGPPN